MGSLTSCWVMAGSMTGGELRNGVRGFVAEAGFARVYCVKPPPGAVRNSEAPAALMGIGGTAGIATGVVLKEGKMEKAGVPAHVGAPSVGAPVKLLAEPPASSAFP